MSRIIFHSGAAADYQAAYVWYLPRSHKAALAFEAAVSAALQRIIDGPESYALIDDCHRRCLLRGYPHSLIYRVLPDGILVVAVAHSRRASSYWKGRD